MKTKLCLSLIAVLIFMITGAAQAQDSIVITIDGAVVANANTAGTNGWLEGTGTYSICEGADLTATVEWSGATPTDITWQANKAVTFSDTHGTTTTVSGITELTEIKVHISDPAYEGWAKVVVGVISTSGLEIILTDGEDVTEFNDTIAASSCPGGIVTYVQNSQQSYLYEMWDKVNFMLLDGPKSGTGGIISFDPQSAGSYKIIKWDPSSTCQINLKSN